MTSKRVIFEGRVQGVGFRYAVKQIALGFDVVGSVKNLADGTVELEVMGERDEVDDFIHEIIEESAMAHNIKNAYTTEIPPLANARGFIISA